MSSTYTTRIRLEKQGSGENASTWGDKLNESVIDLVDSAVGAVTSISLAGVGDAYTVSSADGVSDEARSAVLYFHGSVSTAVSITIPAVEKSYIIGNLTSGGFGIQIKPAGGTEQTIPAGQTTLIYTDGTNVKNVLSSLTGMSQVGASTGTFTSLDADVVNVSVSLSATNITGATGSFSTCISATNLVAETGSFSACVSTTNLVAATGSFTTKVSGVAAEFSAAVCAAEFYGDGSNLTNVAGTVINSSFTRYTTAVSSSNAIPADTTKPQKTEGTETATATLTPSNSSNLLRITATTNIHKGTSSAYAVMCIFRDSDSDAMASQMFGVDNSATPQSGTIMCQVTAGSTSSTTFKLRIGTEAGAYASNQGAAGTALAGVNYGGTLGNSILVEEIKV